MKLIITFFTFSLSFSVLAFEENILLPFTTDGCSAPFNIEILKMKKLTSCCVRHDFSYWQGGTRLEKKYADLKFTECIQEIGVPKLVSNFFYLGVRVGGIAYLKTRWRWGYGWKKSRLYSVLSEEQKNQIKEYEALLDLPIKIVSNSKLDKILNVISLNNFCKKIISNKLESETTLSRPQEDNLYFAKISTKNTDAYQIFSDECKGGYFYIEFPPTFSKYRCFKESYDQITLFTSYGECQKFMNINYE